MAHPLESYSLGVSLLLDELEAFQKPTPAAASEEVPSTASATAVCKVGIASVKESEKSIQERSASLIERLPTASRQRCPTPAVKKRADRVADRSEESPTAPTSPSQASTHADFWQDLEDLMASLERREDVKQDAESGAIAVQARPRIPGGILMHEKPRYLHGDEGLQIQGFNPLGVAAAAGSALLVKTSKELQSDASRPRAVRFAEEAGLVSMRCITLKQPNLTDTFDGFDMSDLCFSDDRF
eukprot:TRINITY_DN94251_c0_g1_i1.p1 TRINITY_DN94251_c0_g1~~TRINITY_DN94251_c0_g1_i1.p1  ORF type:complete len:262 (+),score=63.37 TRINITY_DN94251_c0_g1_i1:61-786(+)